MGEERGIEDGEAGAAGHDPEGGLDEKKAAAGLLQKPSAVEERGVTKSQDKKRTKRTTRSRTTTLRKMRRQELLRRRRSRQVRRRRSRQARKKTRRKTKLKELKQLTQVNKTKSLIRVTRK